MVPFYSMTSTTLRPVLSGSSMFWIKSAFYGAGAGWMLLFGEVASYGFHPQTSVEWPQLITLYGAYGAVFGLIGSYPLRESPRTAAGFATLVATATIGYARLYRETGLDVFSPEGVRVYGAASAIAGVIAVVSFLIASAFRGSPRRGPFIATCSTIFFVPLLVRAYVSLVRTSGSPWLAGSDNSILAHLILVTAVGPLGAYSLRRHRLSVLLPMITLVTVVIAHTDATEMITAMRTPAPNAPNIIVLVCDSERADHTSLMGYPRLTTPFFDTLALQSTVYTRAIAPSPVSSLSIASMWTGLEPTEHGLGPFGKEISRPDECLPVRMKRLGYRTGCIIWERGFENYSGLPHTAFDEFIDAPPALGNFLGGRPDQWSLGIYISAAFGLKIRSIDLGPIEWDRQWRNQIFAFIDRSPKPFFLFAHDLRIHIPINVFPESGPVWGKPMTFQTYRDFWSFEVRATRGEASPKDTEVMRDFRDRYDDALRSHDDFLRELIDHLREKDRLRNTVIIYTADHGEPLGDEGIGVRTVRSITRNVIWVPLLIFDPRDTERHVVGDPMPIAMLPSIVYARAFPGMHAPPSDVVAAGEVNSPYATDGLYLLRDCPVKPEWTAWPGVKLPPPERDARVIRSALDQYKKTITTSP